MIGSLSYGAAAGAFLLLALLLAIGWEGRAIGARLIAAAAVTGLWATALAFRSAGWHVPVPAVFIMEMLRDGAWLYVLLGLAAGLVPPSVVYGAIASWAATVIAGLALLTSWSQADATALGSMIVTRTGLLLALCGLLLVEQIYRNAAQDARRGLRYLAIGVGGMFAYDLFVFSHAEMLQAIPVVTWSARGAVNALAVPFIAVAIRRNPLWSLDIFVSRQAVFYTSTFIAVGIYLIVMAVGGYIVRDLNGTWGTVGQIVFLVGAAGVLVTLIGSSSLRRHATVFINKHFYRNKYDYRVEWLRFIQTLSSTDDSDVRRTAVRAVAQIFSSPGGILFTRDTDGARFAPIVAWPMQVDTVPGIAPVASDCEMVRFLIDRRWIIDLSEYRRTPDLYQNIALPSWLLEVAHLRIVSPMLQLDELVGFFILYEPPPPFQMTYEDRDLLKTVGRHVATQLAQHEADRRLAESRQFEAYNRLTAFMMHDLKNSVAQLQLVVANAAKHKSNPEFVEDAIATIANTSDRMTRLIEQISSKNASSRLRAVKLSAIVATAVERCEQRSPAPTLACSLDDSAVCADFDRLTAVLEHVIRNAQDAATPGSTVTVQALRLDGDAVVRVTDTGRGMDPEFVRERLFRPFDSTKGSKGMGIGAYQTREYVQMLGGRVEVQSSPGSGTQFSITLPVHLGDQLTAGTAADGLSVSPDA